MSKIAINGIVRDMTADEQAKFDAIIGDKSNHTVDTEFDREIRNLRNKRNRLLAETDYLALSDNTLSTDMANYRTQLRDITNGLTTVEDVNAVTFPTKPE
jgi:hypothetical protein